MTEKLTAAPGNNGATFLDFPFAANLDDLQADFAVLGIPFGMDAVLERIPNSRPYYLTIDADGIDTSWALL